MAEMLVDVEVIGLCEVCVKGTTGWGTPSWSWLKDYQRMQNPASSKV